MENIHNTLFGPLSKDYCFLFYVFMVINFIAIVLVFAAIFGEIFLMKKIPVQLIVSEMGFIALSLVAYLQNRILHTMCVQVN